MIKLTTEEIVNIAKKQISGIFKMEPVELRFTHQFQGETDLLTDGALRLNNKHYWAKVMECEFEDHVRPVLLCEVLYFIRNEYMESDVNLEFVYDVSEEAEAVQAEVSAEVKFNDTPELEREQISELIDLALALNDKQWFEELTGKYKQLSA